MDRDPDWPDTVSGWTYFFDFIDRFKTRYPEREWKHVLVEVRLAQRSSPSYPELIPIGGEVYRFVIDHFPGRSDDLHVVVDFEMDRNGRVEPVMGGSNQD